MIIKKAELKSFNSAAYTASVRLYGGYKVYLEDVTVARNVPSAEMIAGRKVALLFFDENNAGEVVVVAVFA
jgi:hypothetical protein